MKRLPSKDRRTKLVEVLNSNPPHTARGQIAWAELYQRHPELQGQLGADTPAGQKRLSAMVTHLRHRGLIPGVGTNGEQPHKPMKKTRASTRRKRSPEEITLTRHIMATYRTAKGNTDWDTAFTEHPDWAQQLGATTPEGAHLVHQLGQRLRMGQYGDVPSTALPVTKTQSVREHTPIPTFHCPLCGGDIARALIRMQAALHAISEP